MGESIEATSVVGLSASPPRAPVRHSDLGLKKYKSRENIERHLELGMLCLAALFEEANTEYICIFCLSQSSTINHSSSELQQNISNLSQLFCQYFIDFNEK